MTEPKPGNGNGGAGSAKPKKERSPNYPAIDLKAAIERARQFYKIEKKNAARAVDAMQHWGFGEKSSGGRMVLSSLVKFGLLEEEGRGEDRHVRLSRTALGIILDEQPISPERDELIKHAALRPKIHAHLWEKYRHELPSEVTLRTYLKRDLGFTDSAVSELIKEYRDTIGFAKLDEADTITGSGQDGDGDEDGGHDDRPDGIEIGEVVRYRPEGTGFRLDAPQREVKKVSPDGLRVLLTGLPDWVSTDKLIRSPRPGSQMTATSPPKPEQPVRTHSGGVETSTSFPQSGFREDAYDIPEGRAVLRWPEKLDAASVDELEDWFNLIVRKMRRITGSPARRPDTDSQ